MSSLTDSKAARGERKRDYAKLFAEFGVVLGEPNGSGEALADECPWCRNDKFYVNVTTGLYHCKHCEDGHGNLVTFLTATHAGYLQETTDDHYRELKEKRGINLQTLKRHGLAYDANGRRWLIPFRSREGNVVNVQFYHPDTGRKSNLAGLPSALYGLDKLSADRDKIVFVCEGPFDAIALDAHLGDNRGRYDVVASPGAFKEAWAEHFRGRKVRALYDNDKAGRAHGDRLRRLLGESKVAKELLILKWPEEYPEGCDVNDLVRDPQYAGVSIVALSKDHGVKVATGPRLPVYHGRRPVMEERPIDWVWQNYLRCGTYVSFSGRRGSLKSTVALDLAARYTSGRPMPLCDRPSMPPGHVLYIHAEDGRDEVENNFECAGGDFGKWHGLPGWLGDDESLNVIASRAAIEEIVREFDIRLVIIDGQNSVVGAPNISTDMGARTNLTNPLHYFAQRLNLCLIGVHNEDAEGRPMGPQSCSDIGRCKVRAVEDGRSNPPQCRLVFEKVQDVARSLYPDVHYTVKDKGGSRREIVWLKRPSAKALENAVRNIGAKKSGAGAGKTPSEKPPL